jgi:hypothetical protein
MGWYEDYERALDLVKSGAKHDPKYDSAYRLVNEVLYEQLMTKQGREVTQSDIESAAEAYKDFVGKGETPDDPKLGRGDDTGLPTAPGTVPGSDEEDDPKIAREGLGGGSKQPSSDDDWDDPGLPRGDKPGSGGGQQKPSEDEEDDPKLAREKKEGDKDKDKKEDEKQDDKKEDDKKDDDQGDEPEDTDDDGTEPDQVDKWENETGTAMPSVDGDDDFMGAHPHFGVAPGDRDPRDVADTRRLLGAVAIGDTGTVDPWDRYDDVGRPPRVYGGNEPDVPWEKIGPKYRPVAAARATAADPGRQASLAAQIISSSTGRGNLK